MAQTGQEICYSFVIVSLLFIEALTSLGLYKERLAKPSACSDSNMQVHHAISAIH